MTAATLTINNNNSTLSLDQAVMPRIETVVRSGALAALDLTGRTVEAAENALNATASAINVAVPATARFIGSFFLPEAVNNPLQKAIGLATTITTSVIKGSFSAAVQAMTFGAPAWSQALRQGVAVSAAINELRHDDSGSELLARCIAQGCRDALIKEPLSQYINLRKELSALEPAGPTAVERCAELSRKISAIETRLRDYQDFRDIKMAFEDRASFVEQQQKRLNEIASQTAERLISQTESFYQREVGWAGGAVAGRWAKGETAAERTAQRDLLREQISLRLANVFERGLSSSETSAELSKVSGQIHSAFGTYQHALKGGLALVGGALIQTGVLNAAFEQVWNYVKTEVDAGLGFVSDSAYSAVRSARDWVGAQIDAIKSWFRGEIANSVSKTFEPVMSAPQQAVDYIAEKADAMAESLVEGYRAVVPSDGPDYSAPYWSGTNKVWTGVNPDGSPMWGESCISEFPSRPRFDAEGLSSSAYERLGAFGNQPSANIESLLAPKSPVVLSPTEQNELRELFRASLSTDK